MAAVFLTTPAILKRFLRLKLQNFAVKSNSENHFTSRQKNSELYSNTILSFLLIHSHTDKIGFSKIELSKLKNQKKSTDFQFQGIVVKIFKKIR